MFHYHKKTKFVDAAYPRYPGETILETDRLTIAYDKYDTVNPIRENAIRINLIFTHGAGMTKAIWTYHIKKLLMQKSLSKDWYFGSIISIDSVGHGDSAVANRGKLGLACAWDTGARDLIKVVKHEQETSGSFVNSLKSKNILVGHSYGGYVAMYAAYLEPNLFDGVVSIESVLYTEEKYQAKFMKIFLKISQLLIDEFDDEESFQQYFKEYSFFKNTHPEVLKDLMNDERIDVIDPDTGEKKIKLKGTVRNQVSAYFGSKLSLLRMSPILPLISVAVCHVVGKKATWNPPESIPYVRNAIPKKYLVQTVDVDEGEHLLNCEMPDTTIKIIHEFILNRVKLALDNNPQRLECIEGGNRERIQEYQWTLLKDRSFEQLETSTVPKSKYNL